MDVFQNLHNIANIINLKSKTVFKGFWHGPPLGHLREACLLSFIQMGHVFELYVYSKLSVPKGIVLKSAEKIIPFDQLFYYNNPETGKQDLGPFSDLFRFKLLSEIGGWWSDVDTICLLADIVKVEKAWAQELPELSERKIGTSQIAMNKKDPLVHELYSRCLKLSRSNYHPREALGPHLLSSTIEELKLPKNIYGSPNTFYPIRWIEMFKLWLPEFKDEVKEKSKSAIFMPIYQSFPQYIGLTLAKLPPQGSYLGDICDIYLPDLIAEGRYDKVEIINGTKEFFKRHSSWAIEELRAVGGEAAILKLGLG